MDITAITNRTVDVATGASTFASISPDSPSNALAVILGIDSQSKSNALQAVKSDPAVLEAHISMDTYHDSIGCTTDVKYDNAFSLPVPEVESNNSYIAPSFPSFEEVFVAQKAALKSLTHEQFTQILNLVQYLRDKRRDQQPYRECTFCKNNGESEECYSSHALKDWRGRVLCPVLRAFRCPRCGATGDRAHTIKYCPKNDHGLYVLK